MACRIAIEKYPRVKLVFLETGAHHPDLYRFKKDCEKWYGGSPIETYKNKNFEDIYDVFSYYGNFSATYNTPRNSGMPPKTYLCTNSLKKQVREKIMRQLNWDKQVFGFEFSIHEINRALTFQQIYPDTKPIFPLIEEGLTKNECAGIVESAGIELPVLYKMGYEHNNCIGCIRGGKQYWQKVRIDFPDVFNKMAQTER
ncbi:hypothetical protein C7N43_39630, partial [Sphingobacteriales bacterium UPWRP_1]